MINSIREYKLQNNNYKYHYIIWFPIYKINNKPICPVIDKNKTQIKEIENELKKTLLENEKALTTKMISTTNNKI